MLRRLLPVLVLALLPASAAEAKTTCKSGQTQFSQGHARTFTKAYRQDGYNYDRLYLCSLTLRHPRVIEDSYGEADWGWSQWRLAGRYLGYVDTWADGVVAGWGVDTVDLATGERRRRELSDESGISPGDPQELAVDRDGAVAFVGTGAGYPAQTVVGWVPNGVYKLKAPHVLATLDVGVVPGSLNFADGVITWTRTDGTAGLVRTR